MMTPSGIPPSLEWMQREPAAAKWLRSVPDLLERCASRWGLTLGPIFPSSSVSWTCPAEWKGRPVVLKVQFPHAECEHEAEALALWAGDRAVRLLDYDPELHALLLERCMPGDHLATRPPQEALRVMIDLLPRLWVPAGKPFKALADEAAEWRVEIPRAYRRSGEPFERVLVDAAIEAIDELAGSQTQSVLLHQDLHADNVLLAGKDRWVAIDPKPLVGERAFGLAPVIRSYELGHSRDAVIGRLAVVADSLGLDRHRVRGWALAQTVAWAFDGDRVSPQHVETARWLHQSAS